MIRRWFKDTFYLEKRSFSDAFGDEPFIDFGHFKGFMQPVAGRLSTTNGKESGEEAMMLYAELTVDISAGDRVIDVYGRKWIAQFSQQRGISGVGSHQEVNVELVR